MVKFLLNAPTTLIQGVAGEVYDVKRVHDRLCVGGFFGGCALEPGESIHCDDLNALAPGVGLGGQPGFEGLLGSARDHVQEPGGTAAVTDGRQVQDDGDIFVPVGGVWRHTCSSTPMTRTPSNRAGSLISERSPSARTAVLAALLGHAPRGWEMRPSPADRSRTAVDRKGLPET